jgi:hypothetical protein
VAEQIFVRKTPRGTKQTIAAGTDNDHRKEQAL